MSSPSLPSSCVQATIGAIVPGGAAHLDGRLQVGDEITHINGLNVMNATHRDVIELMGEAGAHGDVALNIRRKLPHADSGYPTGRYCLCTVVSWSELVSLHGPGCCVVRLWMCVCVWVWCGVGVCLCIRKYV